MEQKKRLVLVVVGCASGSWLIRTNNKHQVKFFWTSNFRNKQADEHRKDRNTCMRTVFFIYQEFGQSNSDLPGSTCIRLVAFDGQSCGLLSSSLSLPAKHKKTQLFLHLHLNRNKLFYDSCVFLFHFASTECTVNSAASCYPTSLFSRATLQVTLRCPQVVCPRQDLCPTPYP